MSKVEIFEPAMCCSTGVCGPGVDPELLRIATFISELEGMGKKIVRYNLSSAPEVFVQNIKVNDALINVGMGALPITVVDDEIKKMGDYPANSDLATWAGMTREDIIEMIKKSQSSSGCEGCGGGNCC
ncbi:arsenite efflux transporter metallochaperone ArsD [Acetobacterium tundrae]|uniref:Arsenite efflux transporter metallochaperone ArsD n=1 Tax=Acetobacterium tundrae TaxID=132932 RepID=A0ABR6WH94_9FIRM|nr:arsenite efflux transporter metallochaperone ArsD [Acetobacterium tundrae]MBC3795724.1 arsenite efflux transporter metallochaperone ArsD [Acetobacterium tundrae]